MLQERPIWAAWIPIDGALDEPQERPLALPQPSTYRRRDLLAGEAIAQKTLQVSGGNPVHALGWDLRRWCGARFWALPFSIFRSNSTSADGFNTTGRDMTAVFTFAMGYNVVYGSWLVGIQSEVSGNLGQRSRRSSPVYRANLPPLQTLGGALCVGFRRRHLVWGESQWLIQRGGMRSHR